MLELDTVGHGGNRVRSSSHFSFRCLVFPVWLPTQKISAALAERLSNVDVLAVGIFV